MSVSEDSRPIFHGRASLIGQYIYYKVSFLLAGSRRPNSLMSLLLSNGFARSSVKLGKRLSIVLKQNGFEVINRYMLITI